ncbi:MAG TPA: RluA family pseudouridine synthase [Polyangia bacterium]|nr:RluA family pseudouridine synthase [Polyangia bacterium]
MTSPFSVDVTGDGRRLDAFVSARLAVSHAAARRLIADGRVRVDGRLRAKGHLVRAGELVTVLPPPELPAVAPATDEQARQLVVLYEDDTLVAIDKPPGIPSHPLRPGERGTAANLLGARFPECVSASLDPREGGLVHRLDTGTSGVLIAARTRDAWSALRQSLADEQSEKSYLAEVWGAPEDGRIAAAIGRRGRRGATVRVDGGRNPQAAETRWSVLARGDETTLVRATLHAGRAHQVRAHLAAAGFPIVGDDRYGSGDDVTASGLRLHAASIAFPHPRTGQRLVIEAPPPAWATRTPFAAHAR